MFSEAVHEKFSSIEVNATRRSMRSSSSKSLKLDEALNIQNEIKIITADDSTFDLWSEVISAHSTGELTDPDSMKKFKEIKGWKPERDGHLNKEFFKFMGNMSTEDLRKLALHILNRSGDKRRHAYPKVTMKKVGTVLESCYSSKDWIERRKRKQMVRRELHKLDPKLGFFGSSGEFRQEKWKEFKKNYNITSATMRVLTEAPGEDFFSLGKLVCNKNKELEEISPYAKAVLELFLKTKKNFKKPLGRAFMRPYDIVANRLGLWPERRWEDSRSDVTLAVLDFRLVPHYSRAADHTIKKPFFESFLAAMAKQMSPALSDPPVWLWICGDKNATSQIVHFAQEQMYSKYNLLFSDYVPCANERLEDRAANNRAARAKVALVFLLKKGSRFADLGKKIPTEFCAPDDKLYQKAGKYNELEYRMSSFEFRMEFYLRIVNLFCKPGDSIVSTLGGGKVICAAMMSSINIFATSYCDEADDFKRIVAIARNLDVLDFAHNAYAVDDAKFPRKVKDSRESTSRGKRKAAEIIDLDDDTSVDAETGEQVLSPLHHDARYPLEDEMDVERTDDTMPAGSSLQPIDDDIDVEGDFRSMQRERAEGSESALRHFASVAELQRVDSDSRPRADATSEGRPDRGKRKVHDGHPSRGTPSLDDHAQQTSSGSPCPSNAARSPHGFDEGPSSQMNFMMKILERQNEQFKEMQLQMQREMQRENREFQREVREESRSLLASVPELIAQTVSKMGLALNPKPLHVLEGNPSSENQFLICNTAASPKSSDSVVPVAHVDVGDFEALPRSSEELVVTATPEDLIATPAATLPGPHDRLVDVIPVKEVTDSINVCAVVEGLNNSEAGETSLQEATAAEKGIDVDDSSAL